MPRTVHHQEGDEPATLIDDRRKSVRYACEVPTLIEKRLFALARTIRQEMD